MHHGGSADRAGGAQWVAERDRATHRVDELGVQAQPRALLSQIRGLELREMGDSRACCGFGGSFSLKYGEVSAAIGDEKIGQIHATGAQAVVLGDLGCMLHLEGRLRRLGDDATKVLHVAQVLAGELEDPS
ncbi:MAG: (Fe-S)-binding protein [Betaproteobacteria bacterium]|nr:(Fe-S)-binding protein [Betaproteobacteria bacterium]